ncbi:MAG TPA: hypothetical protein VII17_02630 [Steroidobacteraceae bacterium]
MTELRAQRGELLVELAQPYLVGFGQTRPGAHELGVIALEQLPRFAIELQPRALTVQCLDAGEQSRIEMNRILVRRQLRRHLALKLQRGSVAVGSGLIEECPRHAGEHCAGALQSNYRVLKARRLGVTGDGRSFGELREWIVRTHGGIGRLPRIAAGGPCVGRQGGDGSE